MYTFQEFQSALVEKLKPHFVQDQAEIFPLRFKQAFSQFYVLIPRSKIDADLLIMSFAQATYFANIQSVKLRRGDIKRMISSLKQIKKHATRTIKLDRRFILYSNGYLSRLLPQIDSDLESLAQLLNELRGSRTYHLQFNPKGRAADRMVGQMKVLLNSKRSLSIKVDAMTFKPPKNVFEKAKTNPTATPTRLATLFFWCLGFAMTTHKLEEWMRATKPKGATSASTSPRTAASTPPGLGKLEPPRRLS